MNGTPTHQDDPDPREIPGHRKAWIGAARQAPALNTQPVGTTCEDCLRFRESECPYPGSNITMNKCNSFLLDIKRHDTALLAQEREKWKRERKASSTTVLSEDEVFFDVTPDPAGYRIYINFYNAGTFSIELSTEQLGRLQRQIYKLLPPDKYEKTPSAIEDITPEGAAIIQQAKKQAREDVLDEPHINQYLERIRKSSVALKDERLRTIISVALSIAADHYESLRSEVGK